MSCSSPCTTKHPILSADAFSCIVIFTRWCPHVTLSIITQDTSGCRCFQQYAFCKRGRLCPQSCSLIHAIEVPADRSPSDRKAARSRTHRKGWWVTLHLFHCVCLHRLGTARFLEQQCQHGCRFYREGKKVIAKLNWTKNVCAADDKTSLWRFLVSVELCVCVCLHGIVLLWFFLASLWHNRVWPTA